MLLPAVSTMLPNRVHRAKATWPAWPGPSTGARAPVHGQVLPPGLRESEAPARAAVHPVDQGGGRGPTTRTLPSRSAVGPPSGATWPRRPKNRVAEPRPLLAGARPIHAAERGIVVADTKFELGFRQWPALVVVVHEVLTPDSSRFWPADGWQPGTTPPSFDKQPLRDWLDRDGLGPPPAPTDPACGCGRRRRGSATSRPTSG